MALSTSIYLGVFVQRYSAKIIRSGAFTSMLARLAKGKARTEFVDKHVNKHVGSVGGRAIINVV